MFDDLSDEQLRGYLEEIDEDDEIEVDSFEANFLQTILCEWEGEMTEKQRGVAIRMCERYLD